jgi:prepilin-type N-terminal cleavage/methylation domain-containing protein
MSSFPQTASAVAAAFTLVELMVVLTVVAILATLAIPSYTRALEQSQANIAAANLRAIWAAEQWWWLEYGTYTGNLPADLANTNNNNNLIDPQIATATTPFHYSLALTDSNHFTAFATRQGSPTWSGMYQVDQTGNVTGQISALNQTPIQPGFQ